jgi:hypothetical protein
VVHNRQQKKRKKIVDLFVLRPHIPSIGNTSQGKAQLELDSKAVRVEHFSGKVRVLLRPEGALYPRRPGEDCSLNVCLEPLVATFGHSGTFRASCT